ncbi:MAG: CBS domain-containing protein [Deltaproteobacteria bacterium]|nr:CBS domain-containing protein [Deltaproteobacteria bacterium]
MSASDPPKPSDRPASDPAAPATSSGPPPDSSPARDSEPELEFTSEPVPKSAPPPPPPKAKAAADAAASRKLPEPKRRRLSQPPPPLANLPPRKFPPEVVADIMTRQLITLGEDASIENVESGMLRFRFRHLPVVSDDNKLLGLISHRDIVQVIAGLHAMRDDKEGQEALVKRVTTGKIMHREVLAVRPDTPLAKAATTMWDSKVGCLPVTEDNGTLVGIVTEADYMKLALQLLDSVAGSKPAPGEKEGEPKPGAQEQSPGADTSPEQPAGQGESEQG